MDKKSVLGNISIAFAAQGVSMTASIIMSLLVPKVLGIENYGYWQLFVFYVSYSGFFHFGLNDGVYLVQGGISRNQIDKLVINSQFHFAIVLQLIIGVLIAATAFIIAPDEERAYVLLAFSVYTVIYNLSGYLGYVFQAMNETRIFSISSILDRIIFLVPMIVLIAMSVNDFRPYVFAYLFSRFCSLIYCCYCAKDILRAGSKNFMDSAKLSFHSIAIGCSLMFANICDNLILGVVRFFIDSAWGIEAFGSVSFALSMVNFFIVFVSQAAMVLFPALRQGTQQEQRDFYVVARDATEVVFPAVYLLYFPISALLSLWLPQYSSSMLYFAILLPICVFNTKMNICCTTYFKVMRMERLLLAINLITLVASVIFASISVWLLGSIEAALLGSTICIIGRSIWCERYFNTVMELNGGFAPIMEVALTLAFVLFALLLEPIPAVVAFSIVLCIYLFTIRNTVMSLFRRLKR